MIRDWITAGPTWRMLAAVIVFAWLFTGAAMGVGALLVWSWMPVLCWLVTLPLALAVIVPIVAFADWITR